MTHTFTRLVEVGVRIEAEVRQAREDRVEAGAQLQTREVHAQALVRAGAEREVVLHGPAESPLVGVVPARLVVVGGCRDHAHR